MADYLSPLPLPPPPPPPPPSLSSFPPLSPPFFFLSAFVFSQGNGSKCKVQVICKGSLQKACPALASVCPTNTKRITAVILATSSLFREPV